MAQLPDLLFQSDQRTKKDAICGILWLQNCESLSK